MSTRWVRLRDGGVPIDVDTFTQAILRYTNADAPVDVPAPGGAKQRSDFHGR